MTVRKLGGVQKLGGVKELGATRALGGIKPRSDDDIDIGPEAEKDLAVLEKQLTEKQKALKSAIKESEQRFLDNVDSDVWFTLSFQNHAQKFAFLEALKIEGLAEDEYDFYFDGQKVADVLGVTLPPGPKWSSVKKNRNFGALSIMQPKGSEETGD